MEMPKLKIQFFNCRSLARKVVHQCIQCTRYKSFTQIMGILHKDRETSSCSFEVIYCSFCLLRHKRCSARTCFWLVHWCFHSGPKRFIGRSGVSSRIYCDNATNFIGAERKLSGLHNYFHSETNKAAITDYASTKLIHLSLIPPRSLHFGGLWEAAVKLAKGHLFRTIPNAHLTFKELSTVLVEIENIINSPTIGPVSTNLLIGRPLQSIPEKTNYDPGIPHLQHW